MFKVNKKSKINFYFIVLLLWLAVYYYKKKVKIDYIISKKWQKKNESVIIKNKIL